MTNLLVATILALFIAGFVLFRIYLVVYAHSVSRRLKAMASRRLAAPKRQVLEAAGSRLAAPKRQVLEAAGSRLAARKKQDKSGE